MFPSYFVLLSSSFFLLPSSLILIPSSLFRLVLINRKSSPPIPMSSSSPAVASTFNVTSTMPQSLYGREEERTDEREEERYSYCVCVCVCVCVFDAIANKTLFSSSFLLLFFVSSSLYQRSLRDPAHPLRLLRAAQEGRVFALDGNRYFARPSPSLAGEKLIYKILSKYTVC